MMINLQKKRKRKTMGERKEGKERERKGKQKEKPGSQRSR